IGAGRQEHGRRTARAPAIGNAIGVAAADALRRIKTGSCSQAGLVGEVMQGGVEEVIVAPDSVWICRVGPATGHVVVDGARSQQAARRNRSEERRVGKECRSRWS